MKFLYVHAMGINRESDDIVQALRKAGHEAVVYNELLKQYAWLNDDVIARLEVFIHDNDIDILLSIHFIMNVALVACRDHMKYVSLLWDAPFVEVYNPLAKLDEIYISTFDKLDRQRFLDFGVKNVIYQPLCVNAALFEAWNEEIQKTLEGDYFHDISLIGQLYDENAYDRIADKFPTNVRDFFDNIFEEAAFKWDGINRIYGKTDGEILESIKQASPDFVIPNRWELKDTEYFERTCLLHKVANIERIVVLNLLAEVHDVTLYTGSGGAAEKMLRNVTIGPPVEAGKATALIYAGTKINLNIALKGIEQGTSQRILDVMGAGGFVLSTYCPETAELFKEDKEIVFFRTPEELLDKVEFYLTHEEERRQVARAGHEKVINCYTYDIKIRELLRWMEIEG